MTERVLNDDDVIAQQPVVYSDTDLVSIAQFADPATAHLVKSEIEAAGIQVFLQGENANSLLPVAFEARIQVRPQDEVAAREIVSQLELTVDEAEAGFESANEAGVKERL